MQPRWEADVFPSNVSTRWRRCLDDELSANCKPAASQQDLEVWRLLRKALRRSLADRGIDIGDDEASFMTRFMLEYAEEKGLRIVPERLTSAMHLATKQALGERKRKTVSWVGWRTKQRWRYEAAIEAAPSWRRGYELDRNGSEK